MSSLRLFTDGRPSVRFWDLRNYETHAHDQRAIGPIAGGYFAAAFNTVSISRRRIALMRD